MGDVAKLSPAQLKEHSAMMSELGKLNEQHIRKGFKAVGAAGEGATIAGSAAKGAGKAAKPGFFSSVGKLIPKSTAGKVGLVGLGAAGLYGASKLLSGPKPVQPPKPTTF